MFSWWIIRLNMSFGLKTCDYDRIWAQIWPNIMTQWVWCLINELSMCWFSCETAFKRLINDFLSFTSINMESEETLKHLLQNWRSSRQSTQRHQDTVGVLKGVLKCCKVSLLTAKWLYSSFWFCTLTHGVMISPNTSGNFYESLHLIWPLIIA